MQLSGLILDGGLATELEARGHNLSDALWSARLLIDAPDDIRAVHRAYLDAGADIIASASYQATIGGFQKCGVAEDRAAELMQQSVTLAGAERDAWWTEADNRQGRRRPLVAASIGPYGAFLADGSEFTGEYGLHQEELVEFHRRRWHLLADAAPDLMLCETIPCLIEARALVELADQTPGTPTWISFSCRDESHISDGTPIRRCAEFIDSRPNVQAIGINCTAPRYISQLIRELRQTTEKPIVVYPNSGETWDAGSRAWSGDASIEDFGQLACRWRDAGASIIGGCCRTTPDHIRAVRLTLQRGG